MNSVMTAPELSQDQQEAAVRIEKWIKAGEGDLSLGGLAGSGKTTLLQHFWPVLKEAGAAIMSPTGKASEVLRKKGILEATTIHRLIYKFKGMQEEASTGKETPIFKDEGGWQTENGERPKLLVTDESSMVSQRVYDDIKSRGLPCFWVGDHGQLAPIGGDPGIMRDPDIKLEKIHRQAAGSNILTLAHKVREGYRPTVSDSGKDVHVIKSNDVDYAVSMAIEQNIDQILVCTNLTRVACNESYRKAMKYKGVLGVGDKIICTFNDYNHMIFNGQIFYVTQIGKHEDKILWIKVAEDIGNGLVELEAWIPLQLAALGNPGFRTVDKIAGATLFDYAYGITVHKCVAPDTLVETPTGLMEIKDIPLRGELGVPCNGPKHYENFYSYEPSDCKKITLNSGTEITVTLNHSCEIRKNNRWTMVDAKELAVGDIVRQKLGVEVEPVEMPFLPTPPATDSRCAVARFPHKMTEELAEFLGLMVGDGTVFKSGFRIAKRHPEVVDRFVELAFILFELTPTDNKPLFSKNKPEGIRCSTFSSIQVSDWLRSLGGLCPHTKDVPMCVMKSSSSIHAKFLRGLFEDGFVNIKDGVADHIGISLKDPKLIQKIRVMLLRLGIGTGFNAQKQKNDSIYIYGDYIEVFKNTIGFISAFKNNRISINNNRAGSGVMIPVSSFWIEKNKKYFSSRNQYANAKNRESISRKTCIYLASQNCEDASEMLNWHYSTITTIEDVQSASMCVEIPDHHKFTQNGLPWGNSQGSEFKSVLFIEQSIPTFDMPRIRYTACTRAKQQLTILVR